VGSSLKPRNGQPSAGAAGGGVSSPGRLVAPVDLARKAASTSGCVSTHCDVSLPWSGDGSDSASRGAPAASCGARKKLSLSPALNWGHDAQSPAKQAFAWYSGVTARTASRAWQQFAGSGYG